MPELKKHYLDSSADSYHSYLSLFKFSEKYNDGRDNSDIVIRFSVVRMSQSIYSDIIDRSLPKASIATPVLLQTLHQWKGSAKHNELVI